MTVPDEAVEAAARWLHDQDCRSALHSGHPADFPCYGWLEEAKELLAEVAPFIAAQAFENGYGHGYSDAIWQKGHNPRERNPYRSEQ